MNTLKVGSQPYQRAASLFIRYSVFVLEKDIKMEDEFDNNDENGTIYSVLYEDDLPVSTGRFLAETDSEARLTRIATLPNYRGKGYGAHVIHSLEKYAVEKGFERLVIHSELTAKSFYESIGYQAFGDIYIEDGEKCQSLQKQIR